LEYWRSMHISMFTYQQPVWREPRAGLADYHFEIKNPSARTVSSETNAPSGS